jgi:hypothetical protein
MISAFQQQGHQAFPLVKLKDNFTNALGDTYHSLLPMVPICLDHTFAQNPDLHSHTALFDHFQPCHAFQQQSLLRSSIWGDIISMTSLPMNQYSFMDEDLGLTTDKSNFVSCCFGCEHSYGKMENIHMRVYGHNIVLSLFHPSLEEIQYCFQ